MSLPESLDRKAVIAAVADAFGIMGESRMLSVHLGHDQFPTLVSVLHDQGFGPELATAVGINPAGIQAIDLDRNGATVTKVGGEQEHIPFDDGPDAA